MRISRFAISVGVASLIAMMKQVVYHWKTARAFAILMRVAKELNTGPGVVWVVINVRIRTRPQSTPLHGTITSPRLFTEKVTAHFKVCVWYVI